MDEITGKLSEQDIIEATLFFMRNMTPEKQKAFSARAKALASETRHPAYLVVLDAIAAYKAHEMYVLEGVFKEYERGSV